MYNNLNDSTYISVVHLSIYKLNENEELPLVHVLSFCPTLGPQTQTLFSWIWKILKKNKTFFCSFSDHDSPEMASSSLTPGEPFIYNSFKNESGLNPAALSTYAHFEQTDNKLHKHTCKPVRNKNLNQPEFKALTSCRRNQDIIIKLADKYSASVIMDKQYCTDGVVRFLSNTDLL